MEDLLSTLHVAEAVVRYPQLRNFFDQKKLNICCQGSYTLGKAAKEFGFDLSEIKGLSLTDKLQNAVPDIAEWRKVTRLTRLVEKIEIHYHRPLSTELNEIIDLFQILLDHHQGDEKHFSEIANVFQEMAIGTQAHMTGEEENIFPLMRYLDYCYQKRIALPEFPGGSIKVPIDRLEYEHVEAEKKIKELKNITHNFTAMADTCTLLSLIYKRIIAMQKSLKDHILVENQILNPMALKIEQYMRGLDEG